MAAETIVFRGIKFRRYPDAPGQAERRYYVPGIADRQRGVKRLHEEIWMARNGPIPAGHHVHHRDHDTLNNHPDNLDAVPDEDHRAHHANDQRGQVTEAQLAHLARVRPLAAAWHSTPEGRAWHAEHGARSWEGREAVTYVCDHCLTTYTSRSTRGDERFCSNRCKAAARRAAGADNETRTCAQCGAEFTANRYSKTACCSRSCGTKRSRAQRARATP